MVSSVEALDSFEGVGLIRYLLIIGGTEKGTVHAYRRNRSIYACRQDPGAASATSLSGGRRDPTSVRRVENKGSTCQVGTGIEKVDDQASAGSVGVDRNGPTALAVLLTRLRRTAVGRAAESAAGAALLTSPADTASTAADSAAPSTLAFGRTEGPEGSRGSEASTGATVLLAHAAPQAPEVVSRSRQEAPDGNVTTAVGETREAHGPLVFATSRNGAETRAKGRRPIVPKRVRKAQVNALIVDKKATTCTVKASQ